MLITAKVKLDTKRDSLEGQKILTFVPDYQDGRNKEWAAATPSLRLTMTVKLDVAAQYAEGAAYTLTFTETED